MNTRYLLAGMLAVSLTVAIPAGAKNAGGKGGGNNGGPGGGGDDGGGDAPPADCSDVAAAFVYRSEHDRNIGEDIILSSDQGRTKTVLASRSNAVIAGLAYHYNSELSQGVVLWAEYDPYENSYRHVSYALTFAVTEDWVTEVGPVEAVNLPVAQDSPPIYLQVPGDVRLIAGSEGVSVHATFLYREWIEEGVSANFELKLLQWDLAGFPATRPSVSGIAAPAPGSLALCGGQACDENAAYRLSAPLFGSWSAGAPSLFGNFQVQAGDSTTLGGILYWPQFGGPPTTLAYGSNGNGQEAIPGVAALHPVDREGFMLVRHFVPEGKRGEYYVSALDAGCAQGMSVADGWQSCLFDDAGRDGKQLAEARFGAAWLAPDTLLHTRVGRKSSDLYRLDLGNDVSSRLLQGGLYPVAGGGE